MLGDATGALKICEVYCQELDQRVDLAAERFRRFAREVELLSKQGNWRQGDNLHN
jgi:hypothetical protein